MKRTDKYDKRLEEARSAFWNTQVKLVIGDRPNGDVLQNRIYDCTADIVLSVLTCNRNVEMERTVLLAIVRNKEFWDRLEDVRGELNPGDTE